MSVLAWGEYTCKKREGGDETLNIPSVMSYQDASDALLELAEMNEKDATALFNAFLRRRVQENGRNGNNPWGVSGGTTRESGLSVEEKKAKLKASRQAKAEINKAKDDLLRKILAGGMTADEARQKLADLGIKA